jgi:hypothetical protein
MSVMTIGADDEEPPVEELAVPLLDEDPVAEVPPVELVPPVEVAPVPDEEVVPPVTSSPLSTLTAVMTPSIGATTFRESRSSMVSS